MLARRKFVIAPTTNNKTNAVERNSFTPIVSMENVSLSFNQQAVFNDLCLTIHTGDKIALLGRSGVGKSSLMKLIAGLEQNTNGLIVNRALRIGYVFQEPRLLPWLDVAQNISEVMKARAVPKNQRESCLDELLNKVGLTGYKHYFPHQLSGGMAQRASLARAFSTEPDLLLLDEPFSALDKHATDELSHLLQQFLTEKTSMLYISHDIEQVLKVTTKCLLLRPSTPPLSCNTATSQERDFFTSHIYPSEVN